MTIIRRRLLVYLAVLSVMTSSSVHAEELWNVLQAHPDYLRGPVWVVRKGKAQVRFTDSSIEIKTYYLEDESGESKINLDDPQLIIEDTLRSDGAISAKGTVLGTDARPMSLTGRYLTRKSREIWGTQRKVITFKEIVFPHPQNFEFLGFISRDVRDE